MSELAKTYEPGAVEAKWYEFWLQSGCFQADPARVSEQRPAYSIVIPPPNVTGVLTLGHVLNNTIQDILARRARMLGKEVLWLPGTDHAGIATQNVVEKNLRKSGEIKHRDDLGREALVKKIWEWKEKYGGIIIQQLKKLGASCDWSRERFTMDAEYSQCVSRVFVDLYKKGLIYRGKRMVNWCPASLTALSDEEVIMKPQNGMLYYFEVEVVDLVPITISERSGDSAPITHSAYEPRSAGQPLTIATTRPETIPGDTAVAISPKHPRASELKGKFVLRPLPLDYQIPIKIIVDEHVASDFGTGVLKVTPAHDKADFEIGLRHDLPVVDIMNPDGTMNALAGESLAGLDRFEARKVAVELLRKSGALVKEEPYQNNVGYSERADVPIEPRLSEQWFLKYPSVRAARECVQQTSYPVSAEKILRNDAKMRFYPDRWAKVYDHWLENIQDWCISRQLWWGHRVPVWTVQTRLEKGYIKNEQAAGLAAVLQKNRRDAVVVLLKQDGTPLNVDLWKDLSQPLDHFEYDGQLTIHIAIAAPDTSLQETLSDSGFTQDPDVLDTWFSSWLWPFATMGWPEKTETLAKFYPTTDLVTGPDIIFFWVARMIMAGFEYMGELPFRNVYFTGIIRDKQGRKMSKSLGNSPDPLDLIAKYGADALRFGVMRSAPLGADILFDEKNVELGRNFCTKLWNAARFRQMQGGATEGEIQPKLLTSDDQWILARLNTAIGEVTTALEEYRFSDATATLYRFFWNEYCDWYLEACKANLASKKEAGDLGSKKEDLGSESGNGAEQLPKSEFLNPKLATNTLAVMDFIFSHTVRLFHPFLPFITEELWHGLGFNDDLPESQGGKTIMNAPWPKTLGQDELAWFGLAADAEKAAEAKYEVVNLGRGLRRDFNIASNKRVRFVLRSAAPVAAHDIEVLRILLNAEPLEVLADYAAPKGTPAALTPLGNLFLPLEGLIDVAAERERLAKEIAKVEQELAKVRAKLADPNFAGKVPAKVLDEHRHREQDWAGKHAQFVKMREALG